VRKTVLIILVWLGITPASAVYALGLGEIQIRSALNQPMDAEIQLLSVRPGETEGMIVSLAPQEAFLRAGVERPFSLTQLRFEIQLNPEGQPFIHVTTRKPIVEPFLNFLVEVDWPRGRLLKEYTVLLDPPVFMADTATAGEPETPMAGGDTQPGAAVPGAIVRSTTPEPTLLPVPQPAATAESAEPMVQAEPEPAFVSPEPEPAFASPEPEPAFASPEPQPAPVAAPIPAPEPMLLEDDSLFPRADISGEYDASNLPSGAGTTMLAAAPGAAEPMSTEPQQPAYQGDTYGPVQQRETLWGIANRVKPQSATVNQMMLALLQYNPEAFFDDNINNLREGVVLRVPQEADVLALDTLSATEEVAAQNALWEQVRQVAVVAEPDVAEQPVSETTGGEAPIATGETDGGRLALVADEQGAETATSVATTASGEAATSEAQQRELALAQEELSSERLQNQELRDRVSEMESIVANVENLITLRENELADLQQKLSDLENQQATATQPVEPVPEPVAEPVAEPAPEPMVAEPEAAPEPVVEVEPEVQPLPEPVVVAEPEPAVPVEPEIQPEPQPTPAVLPPRAERKGFVDQLLDDVMAGRVLENPVLLAIIGGLVSLLLIVWLIVRRRGGEEEAIEVDIEDLPDSMDLEDETGMTVEAVIDETLDEAEMDDGFDAVLGAPLGEEPQMVETVEMGEVVEDAVQEEAEAPKDDTIAEADVYLAYGLYSQSEDLLKQALAEHPDRHEYHEKLLETYFASNNKEAFETQAQVFHTLLAGQSSRLWDRVVAMGGELCPENPLFSGAAELDISAQELQPAKPETPDLELDSEDLTPDLDFGIDEEETYINTGTDFDTGEIPLVDETIHEEDELDATQLLSDAPTLDIDDIGKGDTADHMELDTAEVDRVAETQPPTVKLEGDMDFDITASDLDELGTPTDAFPSAEVDSLDSMDEEDEDAPVLTSGEHPSVATPTGEYDMSRIQDLIQGGSGETAIIPEIPDQDLDSTAEGVDADVTVSDVDFTAEPEFEDDPGPNYNMGGTAELPVMDDVDDFELDLEVEPAAAEGGEESEPSVVSQLVTSVSEDMMDGDDDEPQLVSEIMPAISDDMLDRTIVQDAAAFAGDATADLVDEGDEVETMLDLAKAYLDMGDADSASSALEEIIAAGNDRQRQEAQELLHKIS